VKLREIEVVEDRTAQSRCDEGFLRVARLRLRNLYDDGTRSEVYPCDVVSRPGSDAVVAVLYERDAQGRVQVLLRQSPRAPIYLRRFKRFELADPLQYSELLEVVAGLIEPGDGAGARGLTRRAALEAREEAGCDAEPAAFCVLGEGQFASPGTTDERVYYTAGASELDRRERPSGDGTVMEECAELVVRELRGAIAACRSGEIPDMKTEVALLRLADHLGYLPQLDCFVHELPEALQRRYQRLGLTGLGVDEAGE
jgi:ADP-ribose pyrophosphatase